jgi:hypothetical protein
MDRELARAQLLGVRVVVCASLSINQSINQSIIQPIKSTPHMHTHLEVEQVVRERRDHRDPVRHRRELGAYLGRRQLAGQARLHARADAMERVAYLVA